MRVHTVVNHEGLPGIALGSMPRPAAPITGATTVTPMPAGHDAPYVIGAHARSKRTATPVAVRKARTRPARTSAGGTR